jgi:hypothetical protein
MPGEWHPAWDHARPVLTDWLERRGGLGGLDTILLPRRSRSGWWSSGWPFEQGDPDVTTAVETSWLFQRETIYAPAPYVGKPFVYAWNAGWDDLGRVVASSTVRAVPRWPAPAELRRAR